MLALKELTHLIQDYTTASPLNRLPMRDGGPMFDEPLVGVADGYDPLFAQYKTIIGFFHLTPLEIIQAALDNGESTAHLGLALRVICWALPIAEEVRLSNRRENRGPSDQWAYTRVYGQDFNHVLRSQVIAWLQAAGYLAVAPTLSPLYTQGPTVLEYTSAWSERHALYAAGLGTFSLNDGFITPRGMAMRCGSVITNLPLPVTPRPYPNHLANCLHFNGGACDACIRRCPAGAISSGGHDKARCAEYQERELAPLRQRLNLPIAGCGLCQTGVPCEDCIPSHTLR
ncbi:MAG: epoxyqueuosine reductase [Chloroflexi bacterium]|nr:epoxyqueuosine reductase [Chloroflexota bacterium]